MENNDFRTYGINSKKDKKQTLSDSEKIDELLRITYQKKKPKRTKNR